MKTLIWSITVESSRPLTDMFIIVGLLVLVCWPKLLKLSFIFCFASVIWIAHRAKCILRNKFKPHEILIKKNVTNHHKQAAFTAACLFLIQAEISVKYFFPANLERLKTRLYFT